MSIIRCFHVFKIVNKKTAYIYPIKFFGAPTISKFFNVLLLLISMNCIYTEETIQFIFLFLFFFTTEIFYIFTFIEYYIYFKNLFQKIYLVPLQNISRQ